jgi:hypothetical protein
MNPGRNQDALVTTGVRGQTIGSPRTFVYDPRLNGGLWDMSGGVVNLLLSDPQGNITTVPATIDPAGFSARANWVIAAPEGYWTWAFSVQDAAMLAAGTPPNISLPLVFKAVYSPYSTFQG